MKSFAQIKAEVKAALLKGMAKFGEITDIHSRAKINPESAGSGRTMAHDGRVPMSRNILRRSRRQWAADAAAAKDFRGY